MLIQAIPIDQINPAKYNPRKDLKPGDPEYDRLKKAIQEFGLVDPLVWNRRNGVLVGGHQRLKILKEMGAAEVEVSVVDLDDVAEKALNLALNKTGGDWDEERLRTVLSELESELADIEVTGFSQEEIDALFAEVDAEPDDGDFEFRPGAENLKPFAGAESFYLTDEEKQRFNHIKNIVLEFSGGRDSTMALIWAATHFSDRNIVAVYSETGVEFPGMGAHIAAAADYFRVNLEIVKPEVEWWSWLRKEGRWPSLLFRPCQGAFIHRPTNQIKLKHSPADTLLIDGSRAGQAVRGSKKNKESKLTSDKRLEAYMTYHPCFELTDEAFQNLMDTYKPPLWEGYEMGFVRSACWCCPGQCGTQAYALQQNYPGLANYIRRWEKIIGKVRPEDDKDFDGLVAAGEKKAARDTEEKKYPRKRRASGGGVE